MVMGMVDCVGKEINIGDKVICADSRYADLLIGEVVKLTPQKAWVRYHRSEYGKQYTKEKLNESYQIFKYVEVIRCKDCIYNQNGCCTHSAIYDDTKYRPDYFCADAERRSNETD